MRVVDIFNIVKGEVLPFAGVFLSTPYSPFNSAPILVPFPFEPTLNQFYADTQLQEVDTVLNQLELELWNVILMSSSHWPEIYPLIYWYPWFNWSLTDIRYMQKLTNIYNIIIENINLLYLMFIHNDFIIVIWLWEYLIKLYTLYVKEVVQLYYKKKLMKIQGQ